MGLGSSDSWGPNSDQHQRLPGSNRVILKPRQPEPPAKRAVLLARKMNAEDEDEEDEVNWEKQKYLVPKEGVLESGMLDEYPPSKARRENWEPALTSKERRRLATTPAKRLAEKAEKQAQKERNGGKTDAELAHEARCAANRERAAQEDPDRRKKQAPWYFQVRQKKRAAEAKKNL